jgi:hypothetical protein
MKKLATGKALRLAAAIIAIPLTAQAEAFYGDDECGVITATHEDAGWAAGFNNVAAFNQKLWVVQMRNGLYGAMIGTYPNAIAEERMNYLKDRTIMPTTAFCLAARDVVQVVDTTKTGHALPQDLGDFGKPPPPVVIPPRPPVPVQEEVLNAPPLNPNSDVAILSLDWSMTKRQMVASLAERGFDCTFQTIFKGSFKCTAPQGAEVSIYNDKFEINCEALSACDYSYEQIADDLLASFPIAELRPDTPDLMQLMAVGAGMGYCGPSNGGNHVCSIWSILTGTTVTVKAGELGGGISFD